MRHARRAVFPYVRMYVEAYPHPEMPVPEHQMLISIARRRNPDLLEEAMRDHVLGAGRGIAAFYASASLQSQAGPRQAQGPTRQA